MRLGLRVFKYRDEFVYLTNVETKIMWLALKWRAVAHDIPADARLGESIQGQCNRGRRRSAVNGAYSCRGKLKRIRILLSFEPLILEICESGNKCTTTKLM